MKSYSITYKDPFTEQVKYRSFISESEYKGFIYDNLYDGLVDSCVGSVFEDEREIPLMRYYFKADDCHAVRYMEMQVANNAKFMWNKKSVSTFIIGAYE